jgi:predicted DNA-binding ribbon-helix-helix protein
LFASDGKPSILESRNVTVGNRRTSMRLEPQMWDALEEIAQLEAMTINSICARIDQRRRQSGLTSATRVFIVSYYRKLLGRYRDDTMSLAPSLSLVSWVLDTQIAGRPERASDGPSADREPASDMGWSAEG